MKAIRIDKTQTGSQATFGDFSESDLMDGDLTIDVSFSSLNYKDGLAITGRAPVVRRFPMIPGIDLAGVVRSSSNHQFAPGDQVIATGYGLGETHLGGYAQRAQLPAAWALPLPAGLTLRQTMAIGTAGLTACLSLIALERHGLKPSDGPLIVTGASGGVGSIAIALAAQAGWEVIASTGRTDQEAYLRRLGAREIIDRRSLSEPGKPLGKERWAAGIDAVGSHTLANLLSQTRFAGAIAACGLAQGMGLPTTVAPFILRGVSLLGVDSVMIGLDLKGQAWRRLAEALDIKKLDEITQTTPLQRVIDLAASIVAGHVRGRTVVEII